MSTPTAADARASAGWAGAAGASSAMTPSASPSSASRLGGDGRPVVMLSEHASVVIELGDMAARDLARLAGDRLTVGVGSVPGTWRIGATQHVGTIVTPDVAVLVRPKIPVENLFVLLDVELPPFAWGELPFGYRVDDHLLAAFAEVYVRSVEHTLHQGVLRAYREHAEREMVLRGRIDIAELVRRGGVAVPVPCRYDELTADIAENRYLKAATRRLLRAPGIQPRTRQRLRRIVALLAEAADVVPRVDALDDRPVTRLTRYYQGSLQLARLVFANLTLVDRAGHQDAASFTLDMNKLFQTWVTEQLRRRLRRRLTVDAEPLLHLAVRRQVAMYPDLRIQRAGETVLVGDVKYKRSDTGLARASDYYQLLAYTTVTDLPVGLLVYCQGNAADPDDRELIVRHSGQRLVTHRMDLAGDRASVSAAADRLAQHVLALCR